MGKTTVSIGIPVYNEANNISFLLNSILEQDVSAYDIEKIILYNDASTDDTANKILDFKKNHKASHAIEFINAPNNSGKGIGLNSIFQVSQSDILILLDSDLILDKNNILSLLLQNIERNFKTGLTNGSGTHEKSANAISYVFAFSKSLLYEISQYKPYYASWGGIMALRKEVYKKIHFKPGMHRLDAYIYLKTLELGFEYVYDSTVDVKDRKSFKNVNMAQYLKIQKRSTSYPDNFDEGFDVKFLKNQRDLNMKIKVIAFSKAFFKNPFSGFIYTFYKSFAVVYNTLFSYKSGAKWRS